jgi:hypothetical protein
VIAYRLAAHPDLRVLRLEAGGPDNDPRARAARGDLAVRRWKPDLDWGYRPRRTDLVAGVLGALGPARGDELADPESTTTGATTTGYASSAPTGGTGAEVPHLEPADYRFALAGYQALNPECGDLIVWEDRDDPTREIAHRSPRGRMDSRVRHARTKLPQQGAQRRPPAKLRARHPRRGRIR